MRRNACRPIEPQSEGGEADAETVTLPVIILCHSLEAGLYNVVLRQDETELQCCRTGSNRRVF